jgi:HSP20 family protein
MLPTISKRPTLPSLVNEFFNNEAFSDFFGWNRGVTIPSVNIAESDYGYKIEVAAPGLSKDDFKIDLEDHLLTVSSKKEERNEKKDDRYIRREFSYTSFSRSFSLPEWVNEDKISASQKDGIIVIELPKEEESKARLSKTIKIS